MARAFEKYGQSTMDTQFPNFGVVSREVLERKPAGTRRVSPRMSASAGFASDGDRTMAGYSGTPLAKKLGIGMGTRIFLSDAPKDYLKLVAPLPEGVRVVRKIDGETDIVNIFSTERARLSSSIRATM